MTNASHATRFYSLVFIFPGDIVHQRPPFKGDQKCDVMGRRVNGMHLFCTSHSVRFTLISVPSAFQMTGFMCLTSFFESHMTYGPTYFRVKASDLLCFSVREGCDNELC